MSLVVVLAIAVVGLQVTAGIMTKNKQEEMRVSGISNAATHLSQIGTTGTSTARLVTTSSTQIMATSSTREYARISNLSGNAIYCNADNDKPAVGYSGITIMGSSTIALDEIFPYAGAINCISPLGTASTTVYSASKY